MKKLDYTKLFDVGEKVTLSSDFLSHNYHRNSWEQDCINVQEKQGSLEIIEVDQHSIRIKGTIDGWYLGISNINLHQLEPYKNNYEILYAFANNQVLQGRKRNISTDINSAFIWRDTPEGSDFWINIKKGKHPEYPESKKSIETSKENKQTVQNNNNHEIRLQKQKALVVRGTRPEGSRICSSKHKASIRSRQISYTACHC